MPLWLGPHLRWLSVYCLSVISASCGLGGVCLVYVPGPTKDRWQLADSSIKEEDCSQATCRQEEQTEGDEEGLHGDAAEKEVNQHFVAAVPEEA